MIKNMVKIMKTKNDKTLTLFFLNKLIPDIHTLKRKKLNCELYQNNKSGAYFVFTIIANTIFHTKGDITSFQYDYSPDDDMYDELSWEVFTKKLITSYRELENNNIPEHLYRKHYILTNATITYYNKHIPEKYLNYIPITPTQKYYNLLAKSENLNPIQTRLAYDIIVNNKATVEETLTTVVLPEEWIKTLYF
jgi:hypothetical protein